MTHDRQDQSPPPDNAHTPPASVALVVTHPENLETLTSQADRLLGRLRSVTFVPFESMAPKDAVPHLREGPVAEVRHALDATLKLLRSLSRICQTGAEFDDGATRPRNAVAAYEEGGVTREGVPQPMLDDYTEVLDAWLEGDGIPPGGAQSPEAPAQLRTLARMLETMASHVHGAQAFIGERLTHVTKWGLIAAGEEGRRKARRTLRAAVVLVTRWLQPMRAHRPLPNEPDSLAEALTSRELVMRARADLLTLVDVGMAQSDSDLGPQMREVRMRFTQLMGAQHYGELRVSDRHAIGVNVNELGQWLAKPWNDFGAARKILHHVAETALRLGAINLRAVLLKHDRTTQLRALAMLEALTPQIAEPLAVAPKSADPAASKYAKAAKPRPTAQQKRLTAIAELVGTMRWRTSELQQFFEGLGEPESPPALSAGQVEPLTLMVRRAMS